MKNLIFIFIITAIFSCNTSTDKNSNENNKETKDTTAVKEVVLDNADAEVTAADTSSTGVYQEEVDENSGNSLQDALKSENKSDAVEEGGMSFCDCVKKQKALEKIMVETEDDAEFDKAMADLSAMKTGECKILFADKQNTIEDKQAHERKVKRCLGK